MVSKVETMYFLSKAIDFEGKEIVEGLNGLLNKAMDSHVRAVLRNLKEEAEKHKEKFEKLQKEVQQEEKNDY